MQIRWVFHWPIEPFGMQPPARSARIVQRLHSDPFNRAVDVISQNVDFICSGNVFYAQKCDLPPYAFIVKPSLCICGACVSVRFPLTLQRSYSSQ